VASPFFAEGGTGEQFIDSLITARWKSGEDVTRAAAECLRIGWCSGGDALFREFGVDVVVDGLVRGLLQDRLEGPPLLAAFENGLPVGFFGDLLFRRRRVAWIGGTIANPLLEVGDDLVIELRAGLGHLEIFVLVLDRLNQQRGGGITGLDDIAGFAAGLPTGAGVEHETAFLLRGGAVALVALLREDRADLRLEELDLLRRWSGEELAAEEQKAEMERSFFMPGASG
jgi:hypothetical protein